MTPVMGGGGPWAGARSERKSLPVPRDVARRDLAVGVIEVNEPDPSPRAPEQLACGRHQWMRDVGDRPPGQFVSGGKRAVQKREVDTLYELTNAARPVRPLVDIGNEQRSSGPALDEIAHRVGELVSMRDNERRDADARVQDDGRVGRERVQRDVVARDELAPRPGPCGVT